MTSLLFEFILIGLAGGLLGIFYRDCLKPKYMIFNWWYAILRQWVLESRYDVFPTRWQEFKGWIAYPLGFCIYCSTTWITIFLIILYLSSWKYLPKWQDIVIGTVMALGVQHLIVACACKWLINKHPDLDVDFHKETINNLK